MCGLADRIEEQALKLGLQQGREEGEILGILTAIKALMQTYNCSVVDAKKMIKIKEDDYVIFENLLNES